MYILYYNYNVYNTPRGCDYPYKWQPHNYDSLKLNA